LAYVDNFNQLFLGSCVYVYFFCFGRLAIKGEEREEKENR